MTSILNILWRDTRNIGLLKNQYVPFIRYLEMFVADGRLRKIAVTILHGVI